MAFMKRRAIMNGRADLATQITVTVKTRMKSFIETTGAEDSETVDQKSSAVDDQLAKIDLARSHSIDDWKAPSDALYLLVTVPKDIVYNS